MANDPKTEQAARNAAWFTTTHWSVVLAAGQPDSAEAVQALGKLCRSYWYPLYAYIRRRGYSPEDAQDLTQSFFAHLLRKGFLSGVGPEKGRFRSFLLACLKHFLADEWEKAVKVTVHRLRQRYRELLREEIAHTVERPEEIDEEMRYLFEIVSR